MIAWMQVLQRRHAPDAEHLGAIAGVSADRTSAVECQTSTGSHADSGPAAGVLERVLIVVGAVTAVVALWSADLGPSRVALAKDYLGPTLWPLFGKPALFLAFLAIVSLTWRVTLWLRYKPLPPLAADDLRLPTVTVVIPAYNEGPTVAAAIRALLNSDYPIHKLHIVCVDDGSGDDTARWAEQAALSAPTRVTLLRHEQNRGKRFALFTGFGRVDSDVVVTVDSDTVVARDALRCLVTPLALDAEVGAVAGRIDVLNRERNLLTRMLAVRYRIGFDFSRAYQSQLGSVFVTPGALSAYRVATVRPHWEAWRDVTFLGARCSNGDDHHLANRVLWSGKRTVYQGNAVARTTVPTTYKRLSLMYLRWARSNLRESTLYVANIGDVLQSWRRLPGVIDGVFNYLQFPLRLYLLIAGWLLLFLHPDLLLRSVSMALCVALVHMAIFLKSERTFDAVYTLAYAVFALLTLQWIYPLALLTIRQSRWLTR